MTADCAAIIQQQTVVIGVLTSVIVALGSAVVVWTRRRDNARLPDNTH